MSVPRLAGMAVLCAITFAPASCSKQLADSYQGWIEANLIFVAPDEVGRVRTLTVQEGDTVKAGDLMFTVDDDLQQADLAQIKASVKNAQQSFDRATMLLKTGAGTQKDFDGAEMVLRDAQARLNSVQTRLSRRSVFSASAARCSRSISAPARWCRRAGRCWRSCRPATSRFAFMCRRRLSQASPTATKSTSPAMVARTASQRA